MRLEQWIEGRDAARNGNEEGDDAREKMIKDYQNREGLPNSGLSKNECRLPKNPEGLSS